MKKRITISISELLYEKLFDYIGYYTRKEKMRLTISAAIERLLWRALEDWAKEVWKNAEVREDEEKVRRDVG